MELQRGQGADDESSPDAIFRTDPIEPLDQQNVLAYRLDQSCTGYVNLAFPGQPHGGKLAAHHGILVCGGTELGYPAGPAFVQQCFRPRASYAGAMHQSICQRVRDWLSGFDQLGCPDQLVYGCCLRLS